MIVHVATFLESCGGTIDKDHWLRPIPGRIGWAAYCRKPQYSKQKQKEMAESDVVKQFCALNQEASAIMHDPILKAIWEQKHKNALQEASKHQRKTGKKGSPAVAARLWDYIRHEMSEQRKK